MAPDQGRERPAHAAAPAAVLAGRKVLVYSLLVLASAVTFLFSPAPQGKYCGEYFRINRLMGFSVNCDAAEYLTYAGDPSLLLQPGAPRQNRPLYIVLGTVTGYPIKVLFDLLRPGAISGEVPRLTHGARQRPLVKADIPFYVSYVGLNFLILLASVLLFDRVLSAQGIEQSLICLLSLILVSNDSVKAFFWTAHQQLFNILTPLLAIYFGMKVLHSRVSRVGLWGMGLLAGILLLAYGNFLMMLPCLLVSMCIRARRAGEPLPVLSCLIVTALFALPIATWIAVVTATAGYFYNLEAVEYGQFVWMARASARDGRDVLPTLWVFTQTYVAKLVQNVAVFFGVAAGLIAFNAMRSRSPSVGSAALSQASIRGVAGGVLLGCLLFFWLLGYYKDRLTFALVPPLLCLIAIELQRGIDQGRLSRRIVLYVTGATVGCWMLFTIVRYGPFS